MTKRLLSVGQCGADTASLGHFLRRHFPVTVETADTAEEAMALVMNGPFDLVLVNRIFDADGGSGLDLIHALRKDAVASPIPVMLVSNYPEAQQRAIAAGAHPGFGKAELSDPALVERLTPFLADAPPPEQQAAENQQAAES